VLSAVTGLSFADLLKRDIFDPLGMASSSCRPKDNYLRGHKRNGELAPALPPNAWPAGGAIRSTSSDMVRFLQTCLYSVQLPPDAPSPSPLIAGIRQSVKPIVQLGPKRAQCMSWMRMEMPAGFTIFDKNGATSGFCSYVGFVPETGVGVVLLYNKTCARAAVAGKRILQNLSRMHKGMAPLPDLPEGTEAADKDDDDSE